MGAEEGARALPAGLGEPRLLVDHRRRHAGRRRFAPTLTSDGYVNGGRLFWHVAAVDAEGNQGDWSTTSKVTLAKGMKIGGDVTPARGKSQIVTITVTNVKGVGDQERDGGVSGAGAVPRAKRTNKKGQVRLLVRPTSKGALIFRATKSGFRHRR